jgi:ribosomal protein S6--L-glutamate ligase
MDIAILYGEQSTEHNLLIEAAENYFDTVTAVPVAGTQILYDDGLKLMYKHSDLTDFDAAFIRFFDRDMLFGEYIPEIMIRNGVYTQLDADSLTLANNKFYSVKVLSEGGLNIPRSAYLLSTEQTEKAADEFGYPVVVKLISGYGGQGVMRSSNRSDLAPLIDTITLFEQDICLQQYVENPGEDVRVIVIGDETYCYKRVAEDEEWRSNISQGGNRVPYDAPEETREAAITAARLLGFDICGVDIIESDHGPHIVEANMSPGISEKLQQMIDVNIPNRMMQYMHEQVTQRQSEQGL